MGTTKAMEILALRHTVVHWNVRSYLRELATDRFIDFY
jgi:hypothetical protein